MQDTEFDKLMEGKSAMYADMTNFQRLGGMVGEITKREVQANEVEIPKGTSIEIQKFIKNLRQKKKTERTIRRAVMRKFKINIVND